MSKVDILDIDLEEAKKVLLEKLKTTDKEQLYKDLVSSRLLVEKENNDVVNR